VVCIAGTSGHYHAFADATLAGDSNQLIAGIREIVTKKSESASGTDAYTREFSLSTTAQCWSIQAARFLPRRHLSNLDEEEGIAIMKLVPKLTLKAVLASHVEISSSK
jgi:hypothetical protein